MPEKFIRYYHGEKECPFKVHGPESQNKSMLWFSEECFLRTKENRALMRDYVGEYKCYGLADFSAHDSIPIEFKALLFNRYMKMAYDISKEVPSFKSFYKKYYGKKISDRPKHSPAQLIEFLSGQTRQNVAPESRRIPHSAKLPGRQNPGADKSIPIFKRSLTMEERMYTILKRGDFSLEKFPGNFSKRHDFEMIERVAKTKFFTQKELDGFVLEVENFAKGNGIRLPGNYFYPYNKYFFGLYANRKQKCCWTSDELIRSTLKDFSLLQLFVFGKSMNEDFSMCRFYRGESAYPRNSFDEMYCWHAEREFCNHIDPETKGALRFFRECADTSLRPDLPELLRAYLFDNAYHIACKADFNCSQESLIASARHIFAEDFLPLYKSPRK